MRAHGMKGMRFNVAFMNVLICGRGGGVFRFFTPLVFSSFSLLTSRFLVMLKLKGGRHVDYGLKLRPEEKETFVCLHVPHGLELCRLNLG